MAEDLEAKSFFENIDLATPAELIARLSECESCADRRAVFIEMLNKVGDAAAEEWLTLRHVVARMLWMEHNLQKPKDTP